MTQFDATRISSCLIATFEHHGELASTNDRALELAARDDLLLPVLVLADRQTGGRGRGTNSWWAAEGSLTFSLLLDTAALGIARENWPILSLSTGLAICETLEELVPSGDFGLKWPNDVYCAGRKLCGILIESPTAARGRVIVGIGLNVNNSFQAAPEPLKQIATALVDHLPEPLDLTDVLLALLSHLDTRWRELAEAGFAAQAVDFRRRCILEGRTISIRVATGSSQLTGRCLGIDDDGTLVLQTETRRERIVAGTVEAF